MIPSSPPGFNPTYPSQNELPFVPPTNISNPPPELSFEQRMGNVLNRVESVLQRSAKRRAEEAEMSPLKKGRVEAQETVEPMEIDSLPNSNVSSGTSNLAILNDMNKIFNDLHDLQEVAKAAGNREQLLQIVDVCRVVSAWTVSMSDTLLQTMRRVN